MMAGLTSMVMQGDSAAGLYKDDDEGELVVAGGPGLEALWGLERSVSNAMLQKPKSGRTGHNMDRQ